MRVLLLTPQLPYPPHQGTSLRNYHIIRGLSGRHELSLLSYTESPPTAEALEVLQDQGLKVQTVPAPLRSTAMRLRQLITGRQPDIALRLADLAFDQALEKILNSHDFEIVQIEGIELAHVIPAIRRFNPQAGIVFDNHNAETALQRRTLLTDLGNPRRWPAAVYSWLQVGRLRHFERWACRAADWLVAVSVTDQMALRELLAETPVSMSVIPNSIDLAQYDRAPMDPKKLPGPYDLVFTGKMDYRPNVDAVLWFADVVWPLVRAHRPQATWAIVGQKPHARLAPLHEKAGITITGQVESVLPYLQAAAVYIMPLRIGSGTRLKLLEAMAAEKAIVSTQIGVEGFPVQAGQEVVIADSAREMALAIVALLESPLVRGRMGTAARAFAAQYDWRRIVPLFDQVYDQVSSTRSAA
jgi:glycosyltransferase involved in cell wall biosynthesis